MLTKKSAGAATAQGRLARAVSGMHGRTIDRRTFLKRSGVTAGAAAFAAQLPYGAIGKAEAAPAAAQAAAGEQSQAHRMHALLGRLRGGRGREKWRVGGPGAGVRFPAEPRCALRQGRIGARARHDRALAPAEIPDEAGRRQVPAHQLGPGDRRDHREDVQDSRGVRSRRRLFHRLVQTQQRAGLPAAQVRFALGHQQL